MHFKQSNPTGNACAGTLQLWEGNLDTPCCGTAGHRAVGPPCCCTLLQASAGGRTVPQQGTHLGLPHRPHLEHPGGGGRPEAGGSVLLKAAWEGQRRVTRGAWREQRYVPRVQKTAYPCLDPRTRPYYRHALCSPQLVVMPTCCRGVQRRQTDAAGHRYPKVHQRPTHVGAPKLWGRCIMRSAGMVGCESGGAVTKGPRAS